MLPSSRHVARTSLPGRSSAGKYAERHTRSEANQSGAQRKYAETQTVSDLTTVRNDLAVLTTNTKSSSVQSPPTNGRNVSMMEIDRTVFITPPKVGSEWLETIWSILSRMATITKTRKRVCVTR